MDEVIIETRLIPIMEKKKATYLDGEHRKWEEFTGSFKLDLHDIAKKKAMANKEFKVATKLIVKMPENSKIMGLKVI